MGKFTERLAHAWNAFRSEEQASPNFYQSVGTSYGYRPDRLRVNYSNERTIISSIYTRLSIDVASLDVKHVRTNEDGMYLETINSGLNECLNVEANLDQSGRHLRQDIAMTLFNEGVAAIVPVDTTLNPDKTGGYDILTMRVGTVTEWMPQHVRVRLYDQTDGQKKDLVIPKRRVAIVENPLYSVMNEPNSTLQRLIRKLNMLDSVDEVTSSGKLDIIVQLPYIIKSEARRQQAETRRKDIEMQLTGSKYGIAYTDGTERVTQLNRPAENNLLTQITFLTSQLYAQLGLTEEIFNGTADEKAMLNYHNRTIEPIISAITDAMTRSFLTKTARTQRQDITFFRDPFKLVPVLDLADIADKFTRNEIASSNEMRGVVGWRPSKDPRADELRNKNLNEAQPTPEPGGDDVETPTETDDQQKE